MRDDPLDLDLDQPAGSEEPPETKPRRGKVLGIIGVAAGLVIALALAYMYLRAPSSTPAAGGPAAQPKAAASRAESEIVLPPLDETDALVRQLVGKLSSNPIVAAWLASDGLLLNFALVTDLISNGKSPTKELGAMERVPTFRVRTVRGNVFVDPATYRRYDRYALAISSLDARGTVRLYATLKPRILDAYRRIDQPATDFDPVLERAIVELLRVPVVEGEVELAPSGIVYAYVDPGLEGMSAAQKHLLRMGPKNVQAIQGKLREIADYLGIPVARLPRPSALAVNE
jgi:Protein of unknown function (DUF3014)